MAPSESAILNSFLLRPAPLPSILTLSQFTSYFPPSAQSSPEIKRLYRSLQHRRALLIDQVSDNILTEETRGKAQQRLVVRARQRAENGQQASAEDEEILIEKSISGETSRLPSSKPHTLQSIVPELGRAVEDTMAEIAELEAEAESLIQEISATVGGLSDLRYGRFANQQLGEDVVDSLKGVEAICSAK